MANICPIVKKCDTCDTNFNIACDMNSHMISHGCDKNFKCKFCDTFWVSHLTLELHLMECHGMILHCCDICGYSVNQPAPLKKHKRWVHENARDYFCHICAKGFQQNNW